MIPITQLDRVLGPTNPNEPERTSHAPIAQEFRLNVVLILMVVMLVGSIISMLVIPPFLFKIERTGRVNFFGIKFL